MSAIAVTYPLRVRVRNECDGHLHIIPVYDHGNEEMAAICRMFDDTNREFDLQRFICDEWGTNKRGRRWPQD